MLCLIILTTKLQNILDNKNKFTKLNKNPTNQLKSKFNKFINTNDADCLNIKLPKIMDNYNPGYIYGTVKIHKTVSPL